MAAQLGGAERLGVQPLGRAVERVVLAEVPGLPGTVPSPPFFCPAPLNNGLWHIAVNRLDEVNEQLVRGREDIYFGYEFAIQAGKNKLPAELIPTRRWPR